MIAYASSILTLTGGTSGSRLTPANVINDATAFSTGSTYAVGAIMKYNAGGGLGTALYRCSAAVTVAGAFNAGNWTLLAYINGSTLTVIAAVLEIGAFYDDTRWFYDFVTSGYLRTANGCNWTSGAYVNGIYTSGFKCSNASAGNVFAGGTSSDRIFWYNVAFNKKNGAVNFNNPNLGGLFYNLYVDATASYGDNSDLACPNIVGTNFTYLFANFQINPDNKTGLTHYGLYEGNMVDNKIGVYTNAPTSFVTSGQKFIVATLGTATLANWQTYFSALSSLPSLGDVITATATGTISGSATVKQYKALSRYSPAIPSDNSRGIGLIGSDSFQFYEDLVVPTGFSFATQIKVYYGGTSAYFTRLVNITAKQGASLLSGVKVRTVNTSDNSQLSIDTTNGSGAISKQMLIYSGERVGGGSYVVLQNPKDYRNKSFLFRRKDLVEATYTADMTINGVELTQFMSTDSYYTTDQTANLADVSFVTSGSNITGMTINTLMTLDRLYDITKAYLEANLNITNSFAANGNTFDFGSIAITGLEKISAGTKLNALQSTGVLTSNGVYTIQLIGNVTQATPTNLNGVVITGNLIYNTNTDITVTLTNCTISGTVSNSGTGNVKLNLINSTVNTGARVTAQYPITVTDANGSNFSTQIWVFNSLGNIVEDTGFNSLVVNKTIYMPVGGSIRVYSQAYGTQSKITNTNATNSSLVITHIPETLVDTSLPTATRDTIAGYFSSVVENSLLYVEVDTDLANYTPAEVLNGMHYFIVSNGGNFAALSLLANTVGSVKLIDGGFRVYSAFFKGRAKSNLNATNTPSLFITLPLYIEDASGVAGNQVMVRNANGIDVHAALWSKATANISQNDMNSIAGTTWSHNKRTLNDAIFE